jgi:hypothetical protein
MMVDAEAILGHSDADSILGSAILLACLAAISAGAFLLFRDAWRGVRFLSQTIVFAMRGEKTPGARRREAMRQMQGKVISKEEAVAHARAYAEANGWRFSNPRDVTLSLATIGGEEMTEKPAERYVYRMTIGDWRPPCIVEVDANDGTVLRWRTFPR